MSTSGGFVDKPSVFLSSSIQITDVYFLVEVLNCAERLVSVTLRLLKSVILITSGFTNSSRRQTATAPFANVSASATFGLQSVLLHSYII